RYGAPASACEYTHTDSTPSSLHARITRSAISPRFAIRTLLNMLAQAPRAGRPAPASTVAKGQHYVGRIKNSFCPNSTRSPLLTRIRSMVPFCSALISLNTFIASIRQTVVSGETEEPTLANAGLSGLGEE